MAGKKGRSGRKSWDREAESRALWALSVPVLKRALGPKSTVNEHRKIEIALELVKKMLPTQVTGPDGGALPVLVMSTVASDRPSLAPELTTGGNGQTR